MSLLILDLISKDCQIKCLIEVNQRNKNVFGNCLVFFHIFEIFHVISELFLLIKAGKHWLCDYTKCVNFKVCLTFKEFRYIKCTDIPTFYKGNKETSLVWLRYCTDAIFRFKKWECYSGIFSKIESPISNIGKTVIEHSYKYLFSLIFIKLWGV